MSETVRIDIVIWWRICQCVTAASVAQLEEAKLYIERSVMSRIYTQAMFPNGDADMMRDQ